MNGTTILLWITIFIIGIIAIIAVKLHYRGDELEKDEESIIPKEAIDGLISYGQEKMPNSNKISQNNTQPNPNHNMETYDIYVEPEEENIEYESQNQVLVNYETEIKKFQDPMNETQIDIMTPNNDQNEKHELKDLFTIDELIKESKRKDSEREKESKTIQNEKEDTTEIKESIRKRKDGDIDDKLIEEILADEEIEELLNGEDVQEDNKKEETIQDIIDSAEEKPSEETIQDIVEEKASEESVQEVLEVEDVKEEIIETPEDNEVEAEAPQTATQKDIEEAINTASQEIEEKKDEGFSESEGITDALLNSEEEIKQPTLKSPTKIDESKDEFGSPIDDSNLFSETEEENDLDYRKDLAKITNTIKGSKLFQDVKERLRPEPEPEVDPIADLEETYIRNVNDFEEEDEYAPIINETHDEFGEYYEPDYDYDQAIREENTRKLMNNARKSPEPEIAKPKIEAIKPKPARDNIKIQMGNADMVLKKGDEIIFKYNGDTYSSQVYAINGDDISVRYRRKDITIKPEDVKKIY